MYTDSFGNPIDPAGQGSFVVTNSFGNPTGGLYRGGYGQNWGQAYSNAYTPNQFVQSGYYNAGRPSFGQAFANVAWGKDPQWGNPVDASQASIHSLATKPFDAAAWVAQNVVVPYAAYSGIGGAMMRTGASSPWGAAKAMWAGQGIGAGIGRGLVQGAMTGMGASAGVAGFAGGMGAMAGGLFGGLILPQMAAGVIDQSIIQPFKYGRINSENLRSTFANQYFGTGVGNPVTGKGLSGLAGAEMGNTIARQGLQDWMFSREEYSNLAGTGMRAGLQDFVGQGKMTESIKNVAELVKLTVTIMKDPDTKKAIEQLAQLQLAGADLNNFAGGRTSTAGRALSQLNVFAAMGGTSVQQLMQTVGAQGQAMYQGAGMTPYLGQVAAANVYAGFAGAQRAGLIDPSMMARMGGIQGATASVLGAQMNSASNVVGQMQNYNRYVQGAGSFGNNLTSVIGNFSQGVSRNPLQAMGAMGLYGPQMQGANINSQGVMGVERQLLTMARSLGKNNPSVEELYAIGTAYGFSPDELRAFFNLRASQQAPGAAKQGYGAILGAGEEQTRAFLNQSGLGSAFGRNVSRPLGALTRKAGSYLSGPGEFVNEMVGGFEDVLTGINDWWSYSGISKPVQVANVENLYGEKTSNIGYLRSAREFGEGGTFGLQKNPFLDSRLKKIDALARNGDENAIEYLRATTKEDREKALNKILKSGVLGEAGAALDTTKSSMVEANEARNELEASAVKAERVYEKSSAPIRAVNKGITKSISVGYGENYADKNYSEKDQAKYLYMIGSAESLKTEGDPSKVLSKVKNDSKYAGLLERAKEMTGDGGEAALDENILKLVDNLHRGAIEGGTGALSGAVYRQFENTKGGINALSDEAIRSGMKSAVKSTGGLLLTQGVKTGGIFGGGASEEELRSIQEITKTTAGSMAAASELYQKSNIDYATFSEMSKKMGVAESDRFGAYVDKFGSKVDEMNGVKRDTSRDIIKDSKTAQQIGQNIRDQMNPVPPDSNQKSDTGSGLSSFFFGRKYR